MRTMLSTVLLAVLLCAAAGSADVPETAPFQEVNGDGWIASNARFDAGGWSARLLNRPSFGLQLGEENDIPFEHGTAGATFWVRDAGCPSPFANFGTTCGWKLALAVTQFRSLVVGGNGIEVDGLGLKPPYGRLAAVSDGTSRRFGLTQNIYADWSGADVASDPRWFAGFNVDRDRYEFARGMSSNLTTLASLDADGTFSAAAVTAARVDQSQPESFATRAHLSGGRYVFAFKRAYAHVPVCVASSEGSAPIRVHSSVDACAVISTDGGDASIVNIQITGDPN